MRRFGGRSLWDPGPNPLVYFGLAVLVGISVNILSGRLDSLYPRLSLWISTFVLSGAVLSLLSPAIRRALFPRRALEPISSLRQPAKKYRGLIAFVSFGGGVATARAAIEYHRSTLVRAWLLHSPASEANAQTLKNVYPDIVELVPMTSEAFADPENVREAIERIYEGLDAGLTERDVVIDITGGFKTTTAGAFLGGLPEERNLQVISAAKTDESGRGTDPGDPIEIDISYRVKPLRRR